MSEGLTFSLLSVGALCTIAGLYFGVAALVATWRSYGDGPLLPWVGAGLGVITTLYRRLTPWVRRDTTFHPLSGSATANVTASARARIRVGLPKDGADRELLGALARAVGGIYNEIDEDRIETQENLSAILLQLQALETGLKRESERLEALSKSAVSGDVRVQLVSLLLIGLGTLVSLLPSAWNALASLY